MFKDALSIFPVKAVGCFSALHFPLPKMHLSRHPTLLYQTVQFHVLCFFTRCLFFMETLASVPLGCTVFPTVFSCEL